MTQNTDSDESTAAIVQRVRDELEDIHHLEYVEVEDDEHHAVCVRNADHMENAIVNNGMMAKFRGLGLVVQHIDHDREEVKLRHV